VDECFFVFITGLVMFLHFGQGLWSQATAGPKESLLFLAIAQHTPKDWKLFNLTLARLLPMRLNARRQLQSRIRESAD
jgi:hypothetical protein